MTNTLITLQDILLLVTKWYLGKDASPQNLAPQEISCAEGVSNILHAILPEFPAGVVSTADLFAELKKSKRFRATLTPKSACVIVSPRTATVYGHTGIFVTDDLIVSNDSATGVMKENYTFISWIKKFKEGRKLRTFIFELV